MTAMIRTAGAVGGGAGCGVLSRIAAAFRRMGERARVARELGALSDRELADIGLTRADIPDVVLGLRTGERG